MHKITPNITTGAFCKVSNLQNRGAGAECIMTL
jgi:hypothetical protein